MEKLAILDAGAQYGKVIDRRVRELRVESEILPYNTPASGLKNYKGIIMSGGPKSVHGKDAPKYDPKVFNLGIPILGICYSMQLMCHVASGKVEMKDIGEYGPHDIKIDNNSPLFKGLNNKEQVLMSHWDTVEKPGDGFKIVGKSDGLIAAVENPEKKQYGVQFHPEVDLTLNGKKILKNFLYEICNFSGSFTMEAREEIAIKEIQEKVGDKKVLVLVSGGVDSTVCAVLLREALKPEQIFALHVDTGFMRKNESAKVKKALKDHGLELHIVEADFLNATTKINGKETKKLCETIVPEEKRKIIGDTFVKVAEEAIKDFGLEFEDTLLVQGTLRPDLIESASHMVSKAADTIKTHHNDTQLVRDLREKGRVIEPLKDYHKDEVRQLGKMLDLPDELVWRQPFPGPGLAVRIICAEEPYLDDFDKINKELDDFRQNGIRASLLPFKTVGVQGDERSYKHCVALSGEEDWKLLSQLAVEIPRKVRGVNRVVYVFGEKLGEVKEITPTHLTKDVISQLQEADAIVNKVLAEYDLLKKLSQVPVISFPANFGLDRGRGIGIRTFITNDFMTGVPAIPGKDIPEEAVDEMTKRILKEVEGISRIAYDLTPKPPGTTEWE